MSIIIITILKMSSTFILHNNNAKQLTVINKFVKKNCFQKSVVNIFIIRYKSGTSDAGAVVSLDEKYWTHCQT